MRKGEFRVIQSMTGFAAGKGAEAGYSWAWDLRSVNGKGLDLRLRVPDWIEGLEPKLREKLSKALARGNVTLSLRVSREEVTSQLAVNEAALSSAITALKRIEAEAMEQGLSLAPSTPSDILTLRGVYETASNEGESKSLLPILLNEAEALIADFQVMRGREGTALAEILTRQLDEVTALVTASEDAATARRAEAAANLRAALARVIENTDNVDEGRVAQELAMIAVKTDVTEELDRLRAHVSAARELLGAKGPVGRKFDFLMQEFNREANTLCSKAQSPVLTRIGLEMKTVIDQMREQVQNVE